MSCVAFDAGAAVAKWKTKADEAWKAASFRNRSTSTFPCYICDCVTLFKFL